MKTFDDVITALAAMENGQELVDAAKARVSKVNDEAKGLRTRLHTAETKLNKFFELSGVSPETDVDAIELKTVKTGDNTELVKLQKTVEKLLAENAQAKGELQRKVTSDKIREKLTASKVLPDWLNPIHDVLSTKVKLVDGKLMYSSDDGDVDFDEGVAAYIKNNPAIIANEQRPGSGSSSSSGATATGKTMKRSEFESLPYAEKVKMSNEKIQLTD